MKTNAIVRIILFSLAILILGSILLGAIAFESFTFHGFVSEEDESRNPVQANGVTKGSDIQHLDIEWAAGTITILPDSGSDQILIRETQVSNDKYAMHITQSNQKLKIEYCNEDRFIGFGNHDLEEKDLVISVPADWYCASLDIDAAAAEVTVSGLKIGELEFDGASAVCNLENCHIQTLDVDTASGDVFFSGTLDVLEFDAMSAHFTGNFQNVPNRIDTDSMSGNLDITLPEDCGFTLNLEAMSSDFQSDFSTECYGSSYRHGDGRCQIQVNAMSGDVKIHKHNSSTHHADNHH